MKRSLILLIILPALFTFRSTSQTSSPELYQSKVLTPVNSFTTGVEGPAVDKNGVLYAVNFERQGTIGQVTPSGEASVFVELPEGSIGNGIRFDSYGNMLIADYTRHNILQS